MHTRTVEGFADELATTQLHIHSTVCRVTVSTVLLGFQVTHARRIRHNIGAFPNNTRKRASATAEEGCTMETDHMRSQLKSNINSSSRCCACSS
jgi:hypothetical protein